MIFRREHPVRRSRPKAEVPPLMDLRKRRKRINTTVGLERGQKRRIEREQCPTGRISIRRDRERGRRAEAKEPFLK